MNRVSITSPHNPRLRAAAALQSNRARKQQQRLVVFGRRELERATGAGLVFEELFLSSPLLDPGEADLIEAMVRAGSPGLEAFELSSELFGKLAYGDRMDGVVGVARRPGTGLDRLTVPRDGLILVMEGIEKPGNVGAVIRSADGAGAAAVIAADPATDFFHPNSIRASVSTVFSLPLAAAPSSAVIPWLLDRGTRIVLATLDSERSFFSTDLCGPLAIVMGCEATGVSSQWNAIPGVETACLPMQGTADSLNISAAATAILYLAASQRQAAAGH